MEPCVCEQRGHDFKVRSALISALFSGCPQQVHGIAISSLFLAVVLLVDKGYLFADTKKPTGESVFLKVQ